MKVIIAGSRSFEGKRGVDIVYACLNRMDELHPNIRITQVVSGSAPGPDTYGAAWATMHGIKVKYFPALWNVLDYPGALVPAKRPEESMDKLDESEKNWWRGKEYNILAGYQRNERMAVYADALVAFWDGKSKGTKHMIELMEELGKPVVIFQKKAK